MAAEGAGSLPGDHRHTRGWPLRGQGRGCRGSPRANEGEYADAASRTLAKAPSCSCSSKFQPAVAFFGAMQPAPRQQGLEPAVTLLLPGSEGRSIAFKTGRRLPGKGSKPSLAALQAAGRGSWARARAEPRGGRGGRQQAGRWWQRVLPPARDGFPLLRPSSSSRPTALAAPVGSGSCRSLPLPQPAAPAPQPGSSCGEQLLQFRGARPRPALRQTSNHTHRFGMVRDETKRELLELVWVSFAPVKETHRCQAHDVPISFTTRPVQLLCRL